MFFLISYLTFHNSKISIILGQERKAQRIEVMTYTPQTLKGRVWSPALLHTSNVIEVFHASVSSSVKWGQQCFRDRADEKIQRLGTWEGSPGGSQQGPDSLTAILACPFSKQMLRGLDEGQLLGVCTKLSCLLDHAPAEVTAFIQKGKSFPPFFQRTWMS